MAPKPRGRQTTPGAARGARARAEHEEGAYAFVGAVEVRVERPHKGHAEDPPATARCVRGLPLHRLGAAPMRWVRRSGLSAGAHEAAPGLRGASSARLRQRAGHRRSADAVQGHKTRPADPNGDVSADSETGVPGEAPNGKDNRVTPKLKNNCSPHAAESYPGRSRRADSVQLRSTLADLGGVWPSFGQVLTKFNPHWPINIKSVPILARFWSH